MENPEKILSLAWKWWSQGKQQPLSVPLPSLWGRIGGDSRSWAAQWGGWSRGQKPAVIYSKGPMRQHQQGILVIAWDGAGWKPVSIGVWVEMFINRAGSLRLTSYGNKVIKNFRPETKTMWTMWCLRFAQWNCCCLCPSFLWRLARNLKRSFWVCLWGTSKRWRENEDRYFC